MIWKLSSSRRQSKLLKCIYLDTENAWMTDWHVMKENTYEGLEMKTVNLFLTSFLVYFLFNTGISKYFDLFIHVTWLHIPYLDHNLIPYSGECYEALGWMDKAEDNL